MTCFSSKRYVTPLSFLSASDFFFFPLQGVGYRLNLKMRECDRFMLREDFRPIAVSPGARAMGEVYIGTSAVVGSGVLVKIFGAETERGKVLVVIFSSFGYSIAMA